MTIVSRYGFTSLRYLLWSSDLVRVPLYLKFFAGYFANIYYSLIRYIEITTLEDRTCFTRIGTSTWNTSPWATNISDRGDAYRRTWKLWTWIGFADSDRLRLGREALQRSGFNHWLRVSSRRSYHMVFTFTNCVSLSYTGGTRGGIFMRARVWMDSTITRWVPDTSESK